MKHNRISVSLGISIFVFVCWLWTFLGMAFTDQPRSTRLGVSLAVAAWALGISLVWALMCWLDDKRKSTK